METTGITLWLEKLAGGDQDATRRIWEQYYERLLHVARHRLGRSPRRVADEEDVVLSAFNSFCAGVAAGRFPHLRDRDDLWRLLLTITARKAVSLLRWQHCRRRGGRAVRGTRPLGSRHQTDLRALKRSWVASRPPSSWPWSRRSLPACWTCWTMHRCG